MLNISKNSVSGKINPHSYNSFGLVGDYKYRKIFSRIMVGSMLLVILVSFLPWTQNIRSRGYVTTLQPSQRPQLINAVIPGRIEKWFVREGDFVSKGDTIMFLSEIKDDYFDPNLLLRTEEQIKAKESTVRSYMEKVNALDVQIDALLKTQELKSKQAQNYVRQMKLKIQADSIDYVAATTESRIAEQQLKRQEQLYKDGLKSLTELEQRRLKFQETSAKLIGAESKLLSSRNELINAEIEMNSVINQYRDKISKAESEKFSAMSNMYDAEGVVTKLQNQYMNYSVRQGFYYITAPQEGYITKTLRSGIGETVKEGDNLMTIMPAEIEMAVMMYVEPIDLPLISIGQDVRFMFDGWPSIAFSGWPGLSYGTFGGKVVAIDNFISENGKYRLLVSPDMEDQEWPDGLRVGSGAIGMALLKDVFIWYELWRRLNGFPPDYYAAENQSMEKDKTKK